MRTIDQRSSKAIVGNDRSTILERDRWERSFNDTPKGSLGTIVQRSSKGIVGNDRSTILKSSRWDRSFNDRQKQSLGTIVQRFSKGIVGNDRSTILERDRWERSFNDPQKASLATIVQRSSSALGRGHHRWTYSHGPVAIKPALDTPPHGIHDVRQPGVSSSRILMTWNSPSMRCTWKRMYVSIIIEFQS